MLKIFAAVFLLVFAGVVPASVYAAPASGNPEDVQACYNEATWPVTAGPAYAYGGARVREQKRNGFNHDVFAMKALCRQMASTRADKAGLARDCGRYIANMLDVHGEKARAHALRTHDICQAMTGQSIGDAGI